MGTTNETLRNRSGNLTEGVSDTYVKHNTTRFV